MNTNLEHSSEVSLATAEVTQPQSELLYSSPSKEQKEALQAQLSLPTIDQFPRKSRKKVERAHRQAEEIVHQIDTECIQTLEATQKLAAFQEKVISSPEQFRKESEELVDREIELLDQELDHLLKIHRRLSKGKDVAGLLLQPPSYFSEEAASYHVEDLTRYKFSERNRKEYGEHWFVPINFLRRRRSNNDSSYGYRREQYQQDAKHSLSTRIDNFTDHLRQAGRRTGTDDEYIPFIPKTPQTTDAETTTSYAEETVSILEQMARKSMYMQVFNEKLKLWTEKRKTDLEEVRELREYADDNLFSKLESVLSYQGKEATDARLQFDNNRERLTFAQAEVLARSVLALEEKIKACISVQYPESQRDQEVGNFVPHWLPAEATFIINHLQKIYEELVDAQQQIKTTDSDGAIKGSLSSIRINLEYIVNRLNNFAANIERVHKSNESFPDDENLFWHVGNFQTITERVLGSGYMASRQFQLDHFGEAAFTSASIKKMTKDKITYSTGSGDREVSWEEYESLGKQKDLQQEAHQICFQENSAYMYVDGVALIFSKPRLMSKAQFMSADGIHMFDPDFRTATKDSPGYRVDLYDEPFVVAVEEKKKDDFLVTARTVIAKTSRFIQSGLTIEEWVDAHVIFVDRLNQSDNVNARARELLERQGAEKIDKGYFLPTGERGETASKSQELLYAYVSRDRSENVHPDGTAFSAEKVNQILEENFSPEEVIDELMKDGSLKELYEASAGVWERYSIKEHTLMVIGIFERFIAHDLSDDEKKMFRMLLLLHDIGKPIAVEEDGNPSRQHEFTVPIVLKVLEHCGLPKETIDLCEALVDQDIIGTFLKGWSDINEAAEKIRSLADKLQKTPEEMLRYLVAFYMSDAGAYTKVSGGKQSLDYLFSFDELNNSMDFSKEVTWMSPYNGSTPAERFNTLETALKKVA